MKQSYTLKITLIDGDGKAKDYFSTYEGKNEKDAIKQAWKDYYYAVSITTGGVYSVPTEWSIK